MCAVCAEPVPDRRARQHTAKCPCLPCAVRVPLGATCVTWLQPHLKHTRAPQRDGMQTPCCMPCHAPGFHCKMERCCLCSQDPNAVAALEEARAQAAAAAARAAAAEAARDRAERARAAAEAAWREADLALQVP